MESFRIATWNLERCHSGHQQLADAQQRRMALVEADVWVLTETFTDRSPGSDYVGVHSPPHDLRRSNPDERYTGIWSRWPLTELMEPTPHRRGTIAARIETPLGPIMVYGTVIPYANEPSHDDGRPARQWEVHLAEIARQSNEWRHLATEYPNMPLIVAGDFNQARSGRPHSYGTAETRRALTESLDAAGLTCVSEGDFVVDGTLERSHVEHICVSRHLSTAGPLHVWDRRDHDGLHLSDHPTIAIDLTAATG